MSTGVFVLRKVGGSVLRATDAFRAITPPPPTNTIAPIVTGSAHAGQTLASTTGVWTTTGLALYMYQWQRDNVGNGVYSDIGLATSTSYLLTVLDIGTHVRCVVTSTDGGGVRSANSNSSGLVAGGTVLQLNPYPTSLYPGNY